jgi:purine-nucleoside phosphorylase
MMTITAKIKKSFQQLRKLSNVVYDIAFVTGSGLGNLLTFQENHFDVPYDDIPYFPVSTVEGHQGRLLGGSLFGKNVLLFQGRFHLYEGYSPQDLALPIRVARLMGAKYLFITSASGGLDTGFKPGDIMLIRDHINLTGKNPLVGENLEEFGPRFPDMTEAYPNNLRSIVKEVAKDFEIELKEGVYVAVHGPSLETPAETRFLRLIGADAVGMSTVPEVISAVHCRMKVIAMAVICNVNDYTNMKPISFEEVLKVSQMVAPILSKLWTEIIRRLRING